jgi:CheY-like chemotaxis protein
MPGIDGFELARRIHDGPSAAGAVVVMLSSASHTDDGPRCRKLGIWRYLVKPLFQHDLLQTLIEALQTARPQMPPASSPASSLPVAGPGLHILLVEDNAVNQAVTIRALERKGHHVLLAHNGREAVTLASQGRFDLILMDIQMPEMDGYEATAAIREMERETGSHTPIVAMTAHAMKSDQERCLAAGMDDFISKPIHLNELIQKVEQFSSTSLTS